MAKLKTYTVVLYDKEMKVVDHRDLIKARNKREAYFQIMHKVNKHKWWNAVKLNESEC